MWALTKHVEEGLNVFPECAASHRNERYRSDSTIIGQRCFSFGAKTKEIPSFFTTADHLTIIKHAGGMTCGWVAAQLLCQQ